MSSPNPAVVLENLSFSHDGNPLFHEFSVVIPFGVSLICGDECCGKTSLLRLLAGEIKTGHGEIRMGKLEARRDASAWARAAFWQPPFNSSQNGLKPADCWAQARQQHPFFNEALLPHLVKGLGLEAHLEKTLYMLSTGMRRKVGLVAALACNAPLVLIDEPFAALDKASIVFLLEWLGQASSRPHQACVLADYVAPAGVALAVVIELPQR
jgi:ABC-type multidrug transport system ATPase subunit